MLCVFPNRLSSCNQRTPQNHRKATLCSVQTAKEYRVYVTKVDGVIPRQRRWNRFQLLWARRRTVSTYWTIGLLSHDSPFTSSLTSLIPWPRRSFGHHRWLHNQFRPCVSVLHCPPGLGVLQACPFPDVVFPSLFFCPPCLPPPVAVPCKMFLAKPDERETWPYHFSLSLFTMVRSSLGPIACRILAQTSSLVTWSLYEVRSILR